MEECKLEDFVWATSYQAYLDLQKRGLRKDAFLELEKFILNFKAQDQINRWKFIDLIYRLGEETDNYNLYTPWNLNNNILQPELNEWMKLEPGNPIPYKWSSDFLHLKRSVELNPFDQQALKMYFTRLINGIRLNQHEVEFGFGYSGDPHRDLKAIDDSASFIQNISNAEGREKNRKNLEELKQVALSLLR